MRHLLRLGGLTLMFAWVAQTGCHKPAVREKPLPDPLLTSKKPIEGRPHVTSANLVAREEIPSPPPRPLGERDRPGGSSDLPIVQLLGPRPVR